MWVTLTWEIPWSLVGYSPRVTKSQTQLKKFSIYICIYIYIDIYTHIYTTSSLSIPLLMDI